jgi:hypothetical protein
MTQCAVRTALGARVGAGWQWTRVSERDRPSLNCDSGKGTEPLKKSSAPNERIKREHFFWLKEAKGRNEASIDAVAKALNRFETYTKFRDFKQFHIEQARGFKAHLAEQRNARTREPLSAATLYSTLSA